MDNLFAKIFRFFFKRSANDQKVSDMVLEKRKRMAAESILENESLRAGLDDEAATVLLDWGTACAKQIASDTANLADEAEAQEVIDPRMRSLRQMLRAVISLVTENPSDEQQKELIQELTEQIPIVYKSRAGTPSAEEWPTLLSAQSGNTAQRIKAFRTVIENNIS